MKSGEKSVAAVDGLYRSVCKVIEEGRKVVSIAANAVLVRQNWSIGKLIVEDEQKGRRKAEYGKKERDSEKTLLDVLDETIAVALKAANGGKDPNPECKVCKEKLEFMKGRLSGGFTNFFV